MVTEMKNESIIWPGFGLILGAIPGTLLFVFTMQPLYIPIGPSIGVVLGAIIRSLKHSA